MPTPLQNLGGRRFAFYPPIRNLEPNEWLYRRATWSECVVANARSGEEICIPRIALGEVSSVDEFIMIVALNCELENVRGAIMPRERRVIEFPAPIAAALTSEAVRDTGLALHPAAVVNIRLEPKPESRAVQWLGVAAMLGAIACTIVAGIMVILSGASKGHERYAGAVHQYGRLGDGNSKILRTAPVF
ncbi:MAG: hypothetical protein M3N93_12745 [Acidobacteriota bacterium]|nr:hypothetical protein [Acidobacteriota bacterium]